MTDREKLVELLKNHDYIGFDCTGNCGTCTLRMGYYCVEELLADYLLSKGLSFSNGGENDEQR